MPLRPRLYAALVFAYLVAVSVVAAQPPQRFFALTRDDVVQLERQRAFVHHLAQRLDIPWQFKGTSADLRVLQAIIDSKALSASQTWELQSLGIALGDVFANEKGLRWVIVEDEYGRDPALRYKETSNLVFPLTMIAKRIEEGKAIDVQAIFEGVSDYIEQFHE
ncbi:MAG: DUF3806 domain-containing protein [Rhodocyclaceae bacterium]|nr:DUF3806 domain-containing protein [Rhodocyclaceae bacterium]